MPLFEKGNTFGVGRPKGSKNKIKIDVREEVFAVYEELGGAWRK